MRYVLLKVRAGADQTLKTEDVTGADTDLVTGLRPWLLDNLRTGVHDNGLYAACLVSTNETGAHDIDNDLAMEHVIWYWGKECVPVSA